MSLKCFDFAEELDAIFAPVSSDTGQENVLRLILAGAVVIFPFGENDPLTIQNQDIEMLSDSARALKRQGVHFPKRPEVKVANLRYRQDVLDLPRGEQFDIIVCCNILVAEEGRNDTGFFSLHTGDAQSDKMFEPMAWTETFNRGKGHHLCLVNDYPADHEKFRAIIEERNRGFIKTFSGVTPAHEFSGYSRQMTTYDFIP